MLQSEKGLIIFVSAMDPNNENMMADVLRVSAAVCLVADGYVCYVLIDAHHHYVLHVSSHDRILEALTVNGEISGLQRFEVIVTALKNTDNPALQVRLSICVYMWFSVCGDAHVYVLMCTLAGLHWGGGYLS